MNTEQDLRTLADILFQYDITPKTLKEIMWLVNAVAITYSLNDHNGTMELVDDLAMLIFTKKSGDNDG